MAVLSERTSKYNLLKDLRNLRYTEESMKIAYSGHTIWTNPAEHKDYRFKLDALGKLVMMYPSPWHGFILRLIRVIHSQYTIMVEFQTENYTLPISRYLTK